MVIRKLLLTIICLGLLCGQSIPCATAHSNDDAKAPEFELKDQYDKASAYRFPKQKLTILAFGDRKGSEQIEGWVKPLWDRYNSRIDQTGVAVLCGVPSFARSMVRRIFKTQVKYSVLLDWQGTVSRAYGYEEGKANIFVIDRDGKIVLKVVGAASHDGLNRVYAEIDRML